MSPSGYIFRGVDECSWVRVCPECYSEAATFTVGGIKARPPWRDTPRKGRGHSTCCAWYISAHSYLSTSRIPVRKRCDVNEGVRR